MLDAILIFETSADHKAQGTRSSQEKRSAVDVHALQSYCESGRSQRRLVGLHSHAEAFLCASRTDLHSLVIAPETR